MREIAAVRFIRAIDLYIDDQRAEGRINSPHTDEREYRYVLGRHADDVNNRDPAYENRDDVKRTLNHWTHPNTRSKHRSLLVSFYEWNGRGGSTTEQPGAADEAT
jgi:hypothetical protein